VVVVVVVSMSSSSMYCYGQYLGSKLFGSTVLRILRQDLKIRKIADKWVCHVN